MKIGIELLVVLCCYRAVHAQPAPAGPTDGKSLTKIDTKKIEQLFDEGTKHYDLGEWDQAIAKFKEAYALFPDPSFLFNLGQSYKQKGACREASAAYVAYLRKAPDEDRVKVESFVRELEPCVKIEEETARRFAPPPQLSPRHRRLRRIGYGLVGAGVLTAGGSILFGLRASHAESDLEACNSDPCSVTRADELDQRGRDSARYGIVLGVAAGALVATGVTLVLYTRLRGEYIVTPIKGGALASAQIRF